MKLNKFLFLVSCFLFLVSTQSVSAQKKEINFNYKKSNYQFSISDLKENILFNEIPRTVPYKGNTLLKIANSIINDSIIVLNSLKSFSINIDAIDWTENPLKNDTWQLYYQNLLFVSSLNHAYKNTNEIKYHNKAKAYIKSYIKLHQNKNFTTSKFSWYDHSCAFRTTHIFQTISNELGLNKPDISFIQICFNHLSENIKFMVDPTNYSVHNHSLMMDRSLLYSSKAFISNRFISEDLKNIASKRALNSFDKIIDKSGLAKEHSMTYHIFNHNLYKNIFKLIGQGTTPPDKLLKYLKMNDILVQLIKPDLTFPLWGDSQIEKLSPKLVSDFENDSRLHALLSNYNLNSMVSFENNIATLRSKTTDKSYLALFANYKSKVHKHHDDLSFVYHTLGTDVFTDQGYYGYDKINRPLLMSVFAHNTIVVNNKDYTLGRKGQYSKLNSYTTRDTYEMIEASHNMYDSLTVNRQLFFIKPNLIVVKDDVNGLKKAETLQQIFNIGKGVSKIKNTNNKVVFSMPNNITVSMFTTGVKNTFLEKDFFRSVSPFKIVDSKQIILNSDDPFMETIILIESKQYNLPVTNPYIKNNILFYTKDDIEHKINLN
ncbi:heparinase II/III-family protein [Cellulophaga sp. 20_2_10]|uniref:heparinase II/III domain-containing protein n=1 Tax=Cellulophaga sp. 20_2_10 TaxID=2942476 RepID=UPI00201B32FA|nr:heparinase II/III family protein [Cellulophaga sp. 20_2_10]MCL5247328.1 heparinase II/III-family protein [Cellulophaga sp. 20_2_10]